MSLECDPVTRPRHNQAQSGNHTALKWLTEPLSSVLCLHLLHKPKSWGSAKILKNVDNYEWVTCSEQLRSGPGGLHYCSWPLWDSHQIQILLIFKARVKDASCAQYIMNRQEQFFVKKNQSNWNAKSIWRQSSLLEKGTEIPSILSRTLRVRITFCKMRPRVWVSLVCQPGCRDNTYYTVNWVLIVFLLTLTVTA